jgi:hypothetical protein
VTEIMNGTQHVYLLNFLCSKKDVHPPTPRTRDKTVV